MQSSEQLLKLQIGSYTACSAHLRDLDEQLAEATIIPTSLRNLADVITNAIREASLTRPTPRRIVH